MPGPGFEPGAFGFLRLGGGDFTPYESDAPPG